MVEKEQVIQLINIRYLLERKINKTEDLIEQCYWFSGHNDSIESLLMDILGIPKGFERDDFHGLFEVYTGHISSEEFIRKTECISDSSIKPSTFEIVKRLIIFSSHLQKKVQEIEVTFDGKINLLNEVISMLDKFSKQLFEER